jgi:hypothetical protein
MDRIGVAVKSFADGWRVCSNYSLNTVLGSWLLRDSICHACSIRPLCAAVHMVWWAMAGACMYMYM